jgi:hypothetical protein
MIITFTVHVCGVCVRVCVSVCVCIYVRVFVVILCWTCLVWSPCRLVLHDATVGYKPCALPSLCVISLQPRCQFATAMSICINFALWRFVGGTLHFALAVGFLSDWTERQEWIRPLMPEPLPAPFTPGLQPRPLGRLESLPGDPQDWTWRCLLMKTMRPERASSRDSGMSPSWNLLNVFHELASSSTWRIRL